MKLRITEVSEVGNPKNPINAAYGIRGLIVPDWDHANRIAIPPAIGDYELTSFVQQPSPAPCPISPSAGAPGPQRERREPVAGPKGEPSPVMSPADPGKSQAHTGSAVPPADFAETKILGKMGTLITCMPLAIKKTSGPKARRVVSYTEGNRTRYMACWDPKLFDAVERTLKRRTTFLTETKGDFVNIVGIAQ